MNVRRGWQSNLVRLVEDHVLRSHVLLVTPHRDLLAYLVFVKKGGVAGGSVATGPRPARGRRLSRQSLQRRV